MKKILFMIFAVILMAILNSQFVFAQNAKNGWELETEDGTHPKDERLQLTGFVPQTRVESKKRNLSRQEWWDYINGYKKPLKIIPSNPYWASQWTIYAAEAKKQLIFLMKKATRDYSASEVDLVKLFFKHADEVLVADPVLSTGIVYWKKNGVVAGVGWTVKRAPYKTGDGGERMLVYEGEYGTVKFSLVCGNSFEFEEKTPPPKPEPPKPPMPGLVPCPEVPLTAMPTLKPCPDSGQGSVTVTPSGMPTLKNNGVANAPSQGNPGPMPTKADSGNVQAEQSTVNGMIPATSAGPVKRK